VTTPGQAFKIVGAAIAHDATTGDRENTELHAALAYIAQNHGQRYADLIAGLPSVAALLNPYADDDNATRSR